MENLITVSVCHPQFERIARNGQRLAASAKPSQSEPPFRGPDGQPWSRQWFDC
jgi:hypothetical protein